MNVIPFARPQPLFQPPASEWCSGEVICTCCRHEWTATVPMGQVWLECPQCQVLGGRFRLPFVRDEDHFICQCGNDLMRVTKAATYCPSCGTTLTFPTD